MTPGRISSQARMTTSQTKTNGKRKKTMMTITATMTTKTISKRRRSKMICLQKRRKKKTGLIGTSSKSVQLKATGGKTESASLKIRTAALGAAESVDAGERM